MLKYNKEEVLARINARIAEIERAQKAAELRFEAMVLEWKPKAIEAHIQAIRQVNANAIFKGGNSYFPLDIKLPNPHPPSVVIQIGDTNSQPIRSTYVLEVLREEVLRAVPDKNGSIEMSQSTRRGFPTGSVYGNPWAWLAGEIKVIGLGGEIPIS